jgi:hypothetical protein
MTWTGDPREVRLMIEVVHHACGGEDLDAAAAVLYNRVYHGPDAYFTHILGGWETMLDTLTGFYPFRDLSLDPRMEDPAARRRILHETAACLHVLGRLRLASELGGRAVTAAVEAGDRHNAAISYHNLAESHLAAGALASCRAVATEAPRLAVDAGGQDGLAQAVRAAPGSRPTAGTRAALIRATRSRGMEASGPFRSVTKERNRAVLVSFRGAVPLPRPGGATAGGDRAFLTTDSCLQNRERAAQYVCA